MSLFVKYGVMAQGVIGGHTVRFLDHDDTEIKKETVLHREDATPPDDPTRTNYIFTDWDTAHTNITADTDIKAEYKKELEWTYIGTSATEDGTYDLGNHIGCPSTATAQSLLEGDRPVNTYGGGYEEGFIMKVTAYDTMGGADCTPLYYEAQWTGGE